MAAADRIEQLRNENDRMKRVNEHLRERLERELKRNAERYRAECEATRTRLRFESGELTWAEAFDAIVTK
jgi:regulator of replication initiation timing